MYSQLIQLLTLLKQRQDKMELRIAGLEQDDIQETENDATLSGQLDAMLAELTAASGDAIL